MSPARRRRSYYSRATKLQALGEILSAALNTGKQPKPDRRKFPRKWETLKWVQLELFPVTADDPTEDVPF